MKRTLFCFAAFVTTTTAGLLMIVVLKTKRKNEVAQENVYSFAVYTVFPLVKQTLQVMLREKVNGGKIKLSILQYYCNIFCIYKRIPLKLLYILSGLQVISHYILVYASQVKSYMLFIIIIISRCLYVMCKY